MSALPIAVGAFGGMSIAMTIAWALQRLSGRSGWIDPIWSTATGVTGIFVLLALPATSSRRDAILALVALWSGRLAFDLVRRAGRIGDDPRYAALLCAWERRAASRLFWFLQAQAVAGWVLVISAAFAASNPQSFPSFPDVAGLAVALGGLALEISADHALATHRRTANRDSVCEIGLWSRSRHPNYLGEWLFWLGIALFGVDTAGRFQAGWLALLAPAQMYWLLTRVSGIPPLEEHMRRTRGELYEAYCRRVPAFFPRLR